MNLCWCGCDLLDHDKDGKCMTCPVIKVEQNLDGKCNFIRKCQRFSASPFQVKR